MGLSKFLLFENMQQLSDPSNSSFSVVINSIPNCLWVLLEGAAPCSVTVFGQSHHPCQNCCMQAFHLGAAACSDLGFQKRRHGKSAGWGLETLLPMFLAWSCQVRAVLPCCWKAKVSLQHAIFIQEITCSLSSGSSPHWSCFSYCCRLGSLCLQSHLHFPCSLLLLYSLPCLLFNFAIAQLHSQHVPILIDLFSD